uniref:Pentacotripeptide-repeat region of PRORP domain-containing protein n=1 Tax=Alexandrium andersonii TaxID=327968 RepID=A0A7S2DLH3_9DINO
MELYDMAPIRIGCEHALLACEKGRLWTKALHLLDKMYDHGMSPNEDSFMPAIRACENAGEFAVGDKLFWQMRERTKLERVAAEVGGSGLEQVGREPPKAKPAPWRLPGAIALDAYDPPKLRDSRTNQKRLPEKRQA